MCICWFNIQKNKKLTLFSRCDVLTTMGKKGSLGSETRKFFKALNESRKENLKQLVNCPLVEVEDVADVMGEAPDRLATALQFFLQGTSKRIW